MDLVLIIGPRHAELNDALGLHQALEQACLLILGMGIQRGLDGLQDLGGGLNELRLLVCVTLFQLVQYSLCIRHVCSSRCNRVVRVRPVRLTGVSIR